MFFLTNNILYFIYIFFVIKNTTARNWVVKTQVDIIVLVGIGLRFLLLKSNPELYKFSRINELDYTTLILANNILLILMVIIRESIGSLSIKITNVFVFNKHISIGILLLACFILLTGAGSKLDRGITTFEIVLKLLNPIVLFFICYSLFQSTDNILIRLICVLYLVLEFLTGSKLIFLGIAPVFLSYLGNLRISYFSWIIRMIMVIGIGFILLALSFTMRFGVPFDTITSFYSNKDLILLLVNSTTMRLNILDGMLLSLGEVSLRGIIMSPAYLTKSVFEQILPFVNYQNIDSLGQLIGQHFPINNNVSGGYGGALGVFGILNLLFGSEPFTGLLFMTTLILILALARLAANFTRLFIIQTMFLTIIGGNIDIMLAQLILGWLFILGVNKNTVALIFKSNSWS